MNIGVARSAATRAYSCTSVKKRVCRFDQPTPLRLVGTRSRAIRRRTSKEGANGKTGQGKSLSSDSARALFAEACNKGASRRAAPVGGARSSNGPDARHPVNVSLRYVANEQRPDRSAARRAGGAVCRFSTCAPSTRHGSQLIALDAANRAKSRAQPTVQKYATASGGTCGCVCGKPHRFFKRPQVGRIEADLIITNNDNRIFS